LYQVFWFNSVPIAGRNQNRTEVGADRIANAIAGAHIYQDENLLIVDFGTATTFCAISKDKEYLGGVILAGLRISAEALESRTAKLPSVEITAMRSCLGRGTSESIQSGLYFGNIGMVREIKQRLIDEAFSGGPTRTIGTGGFSGLFDKTGLFDAVVPDLVLKGLNLAMKMNA